MLPSPCPTVEVLAGAVSDPRAAILDAHVADCPTCQRRLAELRREAALLSEMRDALAQSIDPPTRAAVIDTCERVFAQDHAESSGQAVAPERGAEAAKRDADARTPN